MLSARAACVVSYQPGGSHNRNVLSAALEARPPKPRCCLGRSFLRAVRKNVVHVSPPASGHHPITGNVGITWLADVSPCSLPSRVCGFFTVCVSVSTLPLLTLRSDEIRGPSLLQYELILT